MAITFISRHKDDNGLRPLRPSQDLLGVARLIEEAFAHELDRSGRKALREMRWMGRWGFLFVWLDFLNPDVNTYLNGFVWLDQGRIVGNATVSRSSPGAREWFISNLAVAKTHRGQGIARQLMNAAVDFVKEMKGRSISLQVRRGNRAAINLYHTMGFQYISANTFLSMNRIKPVEVIPLPDQQLTIREHNLDVYDAHNAYNLAKATVPVNVQMERPLQQSRFRLGAEVTFNNFGRRLVGLAQAKYWVVEEKPGEFVATLNVEPGVWNTEHKISLMVHPSWWGKLEDCLVSKALMHLKSGPRRPVAFQHPAEHDPGIEAFRRFGFNVDRTHLWMKLILKS